jgi:NitT/TauT family transport system ATP-binding protein
LSATIEIEAIGKTFEGGAGLVPALADIDLTIMPGRFVSIVGPSGCGKSTLLRLIAGLMPATTGRIRIEGREVRGPAENVGFAFQTPVLLPWRSVLKNVTLHDAMRGQRRPDQADRASKLIRMVGLEGFENAYPYELSGGMQQRVALCRALFHDPDLLLMDEPFAALDLMTRETMMVELQRIWMATGKTVLFVTHSIAEAVFLSDEVLVMTARPGRIIERFEVDLPRPREIAMLEDRDFAAVSARARAALTRAMAA